MFLNPVNSKLYEEVEYIANVKRRVRLNSNEDDYDHNDYDQTIEVIIFPDGIAIKPDAYDIEEIEDIEVLIDDDNKIVYVPSAMSVLADEIVKNNPELKGYKVKIGSPVLNV